MISANNITADPESFINSNWQQPKQTKNEHRDLENQTTDIPFQKKTYEIQTKFLYFIKEKQQQMLFYVSYIY